MYMNWLATATLIAWLPIVVFVFNSMPPRKAVANLFVFAWLFLPAGGIGLPGLPDYTKMTATVAGVLACVFIFDQQSLHGLRPRWFDLPVVLWCGGAFLTGVSSGRGAYEGASATLEQLVTWGFPYLIGRIYFRDAMSLQELAKAFLIGGLCYIPFCLLEMRLSPFLAKTVYGIQRWEGERFGGYRPKVFLATSLETATWMANAALVSCVLWACGTIKAIRGVSSGKLALTALATSVLCKSTGALTLLVACLAAYGFSRKLGRSFLIWALVAVPPAYCLTRTFDLWSGRIIVDIANATVGEERAQSFEYRLEMERQLIGNAMLRPWLGWGRFDAGYIATSTGVKWAVPDGFWIIALGVQGALGLVSMVAMFSLPMIRILRQYPVARWGEPEVGPVMALGLMLTLTMIDFLSNAMVNPIFPLMIGGIIGHEPAGLCGQDAEAEEALSLASELTAEGRMSEAGEEFLRAIDLSSARGVGEGPLRARAYAGLGHVLLSAGRVEDAVAAFREALALRDDLAAASPDDVDTFADLATAREELSRALVEAGAAPEGVEERRLALQIWDALAISHPRDIGYLERRSDALNDLAWLLATEPGAGDPSTALGLAEEAVRALPDRDASWNTLGVARYRAGDWAGSIEALERSALAGPDSRGTAFDHFFLAMAWSRLGREDQAREWLERGTAWTARHRPGQPALERFRQEAESLLRHEE